MIEDAEKKLEDGKKQLAELKKVDDLAVKFATLAWLGAASCNNLSWNLEPDKYSNFMQNLSIHNKIHVNLNKSSGPDLFVSLL